MTSDEAREPIAKGKFAEECGVSPGRVSQWIGEGLIPPDAIVGKGQRAKIRPDVARAHLRRHLDIGQMTGNGIDTKLGGPTEVPDPCDADGSDADEPPQSSTPKVLTIEDKIKAAKLEEVERRNREARDKELARVGTYMLTSDAKAQMAKIAGSVLNVVEGGMADIANAIASQFEVPSRDVQHLMRQEFRKVRAAAAAAERRRAGETEEYVEAAQEEGVA
jgi:DNA-binding transcriptional MerR regulator